MFFTSKYEHVTNCSILLSDFLLSLLKTYCVKYINGCYVCFKLCFMLCFNQLKLHFYSAYHMNFTLFFAFLVTMFHDVALYYSC